MIQITNKADCCGCTACASVCAHHAINMEPDKEGFLYPTLNRNLCTECELCEKVCPILQRKGQELLPNQLQYKALRLKNNELLKRSSSGGAFIAMASYVINQGGIVCGAKYTNTAIVIHEFAETLNDTEEFMGSKYSQSDIRNILPQIKKYLKSGRLVLFTGTPCQVHGLNLYLQKKYDNLITMDLVCHAVPSPLIFKEYINYNSKKLNSPIKAIDMRYKGVYGWGHRFAYRYHLQNGKSIIEPNNIEKWGRLFFSKLIDRPSCHECKFTNYNRCGDLTIADFWDDTNKRPDIYSKEGTSLCLVNSKIGALALEAIKETVILWDISKEESEQPCLLRATPPNTQRDKFWNDYYQKGFKYIYRKYFTDSYYVRFKHLIKRTLITLRLWKKKE
jgi:coenzyme F420-reducing hydrogenase beta subunit